MWEKKDTISASEAINEIGIGFTQIRLIVVIGIFHGVDAMETYVLPVLSAALQCSWHISRPEGASLQTGVFLGMLVGAVVCGSLSDRYGRRPMLITTNCFLGFMALLSAFSPTYAWILLLRSLTGLGLGGCTAIAATYVPELVPTRYRAQALASSFLMVGFFLVFALFIAWLTLERLGWRVMLLIFVLPCLVANFLLPCLPQSPRHLLISNRREEAEQMINKMLTANGKPPLSRRLATDSTHAITHRGCLTELFDRRLLKATLLQMAVWFGAGLGHFGVTNLIVFLSATRHPCLQDSDRWSEVPRVDRDISCCPRVASSIYVTAGVSILGGCVGCLLVVFFVEKVGRKAIIIGASSLSAFLVLCLDFCMPESVKNVIYFFDVLSNVALLISLYVYSSEAFPTNIRSTGIGLCNAATRLGAMLSAFPAQVLLTRIGSLPTLAIMSVIFVSVAVTASFFPAEMTRTGLKQSAEEVEDPPDELSRISPRKSD